MTIRTITADAARAICADDEAEHLPYRTLTEAGRAAVAQWVHATAREPERQVLDAWYTAAEDAAGDAGVDEDVIVEMRGMVTASGRPETLRLGDAELEWRVEMDDVSIAIDSLRGERVPLYRRYPRQTEPQPAHVEMDEDGEVSADYSGEIGGAVPMSVWHHRTLRWSVPADVRGAALADLLESAEVRTLLARIHAGHAVEWDGSNHAGLLSEDAHEASEALQALLDAELEDERAPVWQVGDWLPDSLGTYWTDEPLDKAVAQLERAAEDDGVVLDGSIRDELLARALHRHEDGDAITDAQRQALIDAGMIDA